MSIKNISIKELLITLLQHILSHHLISHFFGFLSRWENEVWKNLIIKKFAKYYNINTKEAVSRDLNKYPSFNHFFTRQLKPGVRPITAFENGVASPADGTVSQAGIISEDEIFLAKGKKFTVTALLGGDSKRADLFKNGIFTTIYLSPQDYHRIHMPLNGSIEETVYIPGRLFLINNSAINRVSDLFAKNERVVNIFNTEAGPMALILIGSIFSSSIETVWDGVITPSPKSEIRQWNYPFNPPFAKKGEEMGRFNLGSTVIVLFSKDKVKWETNLVPGSRVQMGELIGKTTL
jgi:phosphatidylserine decarboxylase